MKKTPPKHLSRAAKAWWRSITDEYGIDDQGGKLLLQTALEAFDRMKAAAKQIDTDGEAVKDRFDQIKPHPLLNAERDARSQMLAALVCSYLMGQKGPVGAEGQAAHLAIRYRQSERSSRLSP